MKRFFCSLLAASMFAVPALAESDAAALAQSLVPESAVLISQEKEDGFTSFEYWVDSSQEFVEILIDPATQQLQRVEYEQRNGYPEQGGRPGQGAGHVSRCLRGLCVAGYRRRPQQL